jgi:excisionase family DNA binding protein
MGTGNGGNGSSKPRNEESESLIEDLCQQINTSHSESSLNYNYKTLNDTMDREFRDKFKDFEPYDFSKIRGITEKAKKEASKQKKLDTKIKYLSNVLDKVKNIIANDNNVYEILLQEEKILDPDDNWERQNELEKANNLKKQLEFLIEDLNFEKDEGTNVPSEPSIKEIYVKTSTPEIEPPREHMNAQQAADYLGVSKSTIDHKALSGEIKSSKIGSRRYRKIDLDEYVASHISKKPKRQAVINEDSKKLHYTIEKQFLELITNVFVEKEYIDNDSAIVMKDRFSEIPKQEKGQILWKKDLVSLLTFIYLADRLEYIERGNQENFQRHSATSSGEIKEYRHDPPLDKEVYYTKFVNENFKFSENIKSNDGQLTRKWKAINSIIIKMRDKMAYWKGIKEDILDYKWNDKKGLSISSNTDELLKNQISRKEAIIYYFMTNKDFEINKKKIDLNILTIFKQIRQELKDKHSKSQTEIK